jgi:hypothetical protein
VGSEELRGVRDLGERERVCRHAQVRARDADDLTRPDHRAAPDLAAALRVRANAPEAEADVLRLAEARHQLRLEQVEAVRRAARDGALDKLLLLDARAHLHDLLERELGVAGAGDADLLALAGRQAAAKLPEVRVHPLIVEVEMLAGQPVPDRRDQRLRFVVLAEPLEDAKEVEEEEEDHDRGQRQACLAGPRGDLLGHVRSKRRPADDPRMPSSRPCGCA